MIWKPKKGGLFHAALVLPLLAIPLLGVEAPGGALAPAAGFRESVQPILKNYCSDCHGDGEKKGDVSFDEFKSDADLLQPELWLRVLRNTRAGLMPPAKKPHPTAEEREKLEHWIKYAAFGIDPQNPDPGRVTVRRLNRVEYRNTIQDLMGIDFNSEVEFPPDDTGYGFDNIGDVLTVSPMLLEKYLAAAKTIVAQAVPLVGKVMPERTIAGSRFRRAQTGDGEKGKGGRNRQETMLSLGYYEPASVSTRIQADHAGAYRLSVDLAVKGNFDFDPGRCRVTLKLDGRELLQKELGWYDNKTFTFDFNEKWEPGEKQLSVDLEPLTPVEKKINSLELRIVQVVVKGPMEKEHWTIAKNYDRFFTREAPENPAERRAYAQEVLGAFASKAFRRPVDEKTAARLAGLAESIYTQPGKSFEVGIAHALVATLASPRFLFRVEEPQSPSPSGFALVDEYSLASRLSYFLWSTMPDRELLDLAARGELRKNLASQVKRMLADSRFENLVKSFTGQWLQTRDVEGISVNARVILARDDGQEKELRRQQEEFRAFLAQRAAARAAATNKTMAGSATNNVAGTNSAGGTNLLAQRQRFGNNRRFFAPPRVDLDRDLREAMRHETEMFFASIVQEDRPVTELINADYTFLNEKLAGLYGLTNLNITGSEMRRVKLPADSPRGGVLTHGSSLVVTSNPDRTSPVKRGLFILDNFLGLPTPPPPANVPALETVDKDFDHQEPTLRQALAVHREKPLCASCHNRMDPIGLAFENFNAMGMWRGKERNQTIESGGKLVTGETFENVRELKEILANGHRLDFYRCLAEKMLTYALGRGPEFYDIETLDRIVDRLNRSEGRFSALLMGVIDSAPFQKMRTEPNPGPKTRADSPKTATGERVAQLQTQP